jgi:hypothetical protein
MWGMQTSFTEALQIMGRAARGTGFNGIIAVYWYMSQLTRVTDPKKNKIENQNSILSLESKFFILPSASSQEQVQCRRVTIMSVYDEISRSIETHPICCDVCMMKKWFNENENILPFIDSGIDVNKKEKEKLKYIENIRLNLTNSYMKEFLGIPIDFKRPERILILEEVVSVSIQTPKNPVLRTDFDRQVYDALECELRKHIIILHKTSKEPSYYMRPLCFVINDSVLYKLFAYYFWVILNHN